MKLSDAQQIGSDLLQKLIPHCGRIALGGSIRRLRPECNDVDVIAEVTDPISFKHQLELLMPELPMRGPKIFRGRFKGAEIDIYAANASTYDTLLLIRTGSKEHNIRLTRAAIRKGWKLKADGTGLVDTHGNILATTEKDIFAKLGLDYLPPEERDGVWP